MKFCQRGPVEGLSGAGLKRDIAAMAELVALSRLAGCFVQTRDTQLHVIRSRDRSPGIGLRTSGGSQFSFTRAQHLREWHSNSLDTGLLSSLTGIHHFSSALGWCCCGFCSDELRTVPAQQHQLQKPQQHQSPRHTAAKA